MIKIAPFIRITAENGKTLQDAISDFDYLYSEEEDDVCELTIESDNPKLADEPAFREGNSLTVTWGYLDYSPLVNSRKVYIFDTRCDYSEQGIKLTLICHEKFAISKMDTAKNKNSRGDSNKDITKILLSNDVLENLDITDENQTSIYKLLDAASRDKNNKLDPRTKTISSNTESSFTKGDNSLNTSNTNQGSIPKPNADGSISPQLSRTEAGMTITLYNGSNATYRTLKNFFDKQEGGPYVIDSRDDTVTVRTRDMSSSPIREYIYKGEDGELLSFTPESKNRSNAKTSETINTVNWDSSNKLAIDQQTTKDGKKTQDNTPVMKIWNASPVPMNPIWFQTRQEENSRARIIGPNSKKIGTKDWKKDKGAGDPPLESGKYRKYETDRGWTIYSESLVNQLGQSNPSKIFGVRNGDSTNVQDYIQKQKNKTVQGPSKTLVMGSESSSKSKAFAENRRKNDELDTNPATASMVGNPLLESGKMIKISNVASKHSGNYYIKSCRHKMDQQGYITTIESMVRSEGSTNNKNKGVKSNRPSKDKAKTKVVTNSEGRSYEVMDFSDMISNPTAMSKEHQSRVGLVKKVPVVTPKESKKK